MTRRLSFRVTVAQEPAEPPRSRHFVLWIALLASLSWAACVGLAWVIAGVIHLVARALA